MLKFCYHTCFVVPVSTQDIYTHLYLLVTNRCAARAQRAHPAPIKSGSLHGPQQIALIAQRLSDARNP